MGRKGRPAMKPAERVEALQALLEKAFKEFNDIPESRKTARVVVRKRILRIQNQLREAQWLKDQS